jgi:hypothetical protein
VAAVLKERPGLQRVRVSGLPVGERAYCLTAVTGTVAVGDRVVVNTTAVELGLGTGGWHVVHWNLSRAELIQPGPDHVMKVRYTSLQIDAGTDELRSPDLPASLEGVPVVACLVHSQVGLVAVAIKSAAPHLRVGYVMTDGAALPLALSDLVAELRDRSLLDVTVTAGHAFGGDLEAVTVPSALLLARHVAEADVIVVGMGPGVVGTGTKFGTTSIEAAAILDATDALGGEPVLCVRASDGDARSRHQGISHHSSTVLELAACRPWVAPVPPDLAQSTRVRIRPVILPDAVSLLDGLGLSIRTMGRGPDEDPLFFAAAAAAGAVAVDLVAHP